MKPKAFLSYAHWDDDDGSLTKLRTRLIREVRMFAGTDFEIFQDRTDIEWGENWRRRIEESLDEVTFLIPIITPTYLDSDECRAEVQLFLEHEEQIGRDDLILPLYFVESPMWDDEQEYQNDEIVRALRRHQFIDWRDLQGKSFEDQEVRGELENLARQIRDALNRVKAAGGQVESKPSRTAPPSRTSRTGTILSSISRVRQEDRIRRRTYSNLFHRHSEVEFAEGYAIAHIKDHQPNYPFLVGKTYELQTGVRSDIPEGFQGVSILLPLREDIQLDIVVHADMEISPSWVQPYTFSWSHEPQLLTFLLQPTSPGYKQIRVEFIYQRHWLAKIQFEIEVVEAQPSIPV